MVIHVDGRALLIDDLTLGELRAVEEKTNIPWTRINPLRSAGEASAVLLVLFKREGLTDEQAQAKVDAIPFAKVLDEYIRLEDGPADDRPAEYDDGMPVIDPKAGPAAPGTTTSS